MDVRNIKETPRAVSLTARHNSKYRNASGAAKYFAPFKQRKLIDENSDDIDLKAFKGHDELCPLIWKDGVMDDKVRIALMKAAKKFIEFIGVDLAVKDIALVGSMAGYNWHDKSDLDIHIFVDGKKVDADDDVVSELFYAKKTIWNTQYNIRMKGHEVEMYVQDINDPETAGGVFSLVRNAWTKKPEKNNVTPDLKAAKLKASAIMALIDGAFDASNEERRLSRLEKIMHKIRAMRAVGLDKEMGEFSPENIAFKILRNSGYMKKLTNMETKATNAYLSMNEARSPLMEAASPKYDFGCLMAFFNPPAWDKLLDVIDPDDIYEGDGGFGLERDPHVTILFGFHDEKVDVKELKDRVKRLVGDRKVVFKFGQASLFDNPLYDVLKFDIEDTTGILGELNEAIRQMYEHTNSYPNYHPHATIAYIKKGEGQKYADLINKSELHMDVTPDKMVYSKPPGPTKYFWRLDKEGNRLELAKGLEDMTPEKVEAIKAFVMYTKKKLGIKGRVFVSLRAGRDEYIRSTAAYGPAEDKNYIRCNGRALVDILRSIGHELVHNKQREDGVFKVGEAVQDIGGNVENQANAIAGILIKDFAQNHGHDHIYDM